MARYRKRPVEVEAVQYTGANAAEIKRFVSTAPSGDDGFLEAHEIAGNARAGCVWNASHNDWNAVNVRDWIIRGTAGEFYPCEPAIFEATYEPVEET